MEIIFAIDIFNFNFNQIVGYLYDKNNYCHSKHIIRIETSRFYLLFTTYAVYGILLFTLQSTSEVNN